MGVALVFTKKNKNYHRRNASQLQDGGFLEDFFAVYPEAWVALDTANLVTFFAGKNAQIFFLVQPGPKYHIDKERSHLHLLSTYIYMRYYKTSFVNRPCQLVAQL